MTFEHLFKHGPTKNCSSSHHACANERHKPACKCLTRADTDRKNIASGNNELLLSPSRLLWTDPAFSEAGRLSFPSFPSFFFFLKSMLIILLGHFDVSWETNIAAHTPLQPSSLICFGRKLLDLCPSCFIFLSPRLELFNLFRGGRGPRRHLAPSCRYSLSTPTFHCLSFVLRHPVQIFQPDSADFSISKILSLIHI